MRSFLKPGLDVERHNEEVRALWEAYGKREHGRAPVLVSGSIRNLFNNPEVHTTGYTFEDFFQRPEAQVACQLAYQSWVRHNLICDREMGPPPDGWPLAVDFQNSYEAGWFGCPLRYFGNDVPDTEEILRADKRRLYDLPAPDPLRGGLLGRAMDFFEYMHAECPTLEFEGRPVKPPATIPGEGTDGPFDVAYKLRGAAEVCLDMLEDPDYFHDLMTYVTDNIIRRMKAIREWRWARCPAAPDKGQYRRKGFAFADDAIAMISEADYREHVFPYHQRIADAFSDGTMSIHLCGDATRHFRFLRDHLGVQSFDTGFPVDFGTLRRELGPDVQILGGPTVMLLKEGSPEAVRSEVRRICATGVLEGRRFVFREGNNLAPCTPVENIEAFYMAAQEYGRYA